MEVLDTECGPWPYPVIGYENFDFAYEYHEG